MNGFAERGLNTARSMSRAGDGSPHRALDLSPRARAIFFSAFYSLAFQIRGLIGERGILPRRRLSRERARSAAARRAGVVRADALLARRERPRPDGRRRGGARLRRCSLVANVWPKLTSRCARCSSCRASPRLQDFSSYQSDGMLLEAGFISIFFAPRGLRPGLGASDPPSRVSLFMLRWEWFRIYFESGVVKLASGDPHWRNLTAMDDYYQNGPLPAWPGWYVQHSAALVSRRRRSSLTLVVELVLVWAVFLPRTVPHRVLRRRDGAADRHHRDGELRVPELSRARARRPAARRRALARVARCASASA